MYFPQIHPRPAQGWINDPNGIMFYEGRYHLMMQHNPHSARHATIHWGHFSSTDLLAWREEPLAVVPRDGFDPLGAWSGVGAVIDGEPVLVYSGVPTKYGDSDAVIARRSGDAFKQAAVAAPMLTEPVAHRGELLTVTEIRDPFLFEYEGRRLAVQGCGFTGNRAGILLYDASDLDSWRLLGPLLVSTDLPAAVADELDAHIFECPQLFRVGDAWVLNVSLWHRVPEGEHGLDGVAYAVGDLVADGESMRFVAETAGRLDAGPDFYAPQAVPLGAGALAGDDGTERTLLWGWSWEHASRTQAETDAQGWAGILTLPREIVARDGDARGGLLAVPARELMGLRVGAGEEATRVRVTGASEIVAPAGTRVRFTAGGTSLEFEAGEGGLRAFIDASLLEVFSDAIAAGGTHTERLYPRDGEWLVEASAPVMAYALAVPGGADARVAQSAESPAVAVLA
ncbi:glycoside hydrolase family 32 protein [Micrococcales bacterium 31B]|nr:glycoside hydrolase family 32 protein [Micrococcales bacterium 31B]